MARSSSPTSASSISALRKRASAILRAALIAVSLALIVTVLISAGVNDRGDKYSSRSAGRDKSGSCTREIFVKNIPDSLICCDRTMHQYDWVCVASADRAGKLLASSWAFVLPFVPWAVNVAFDVGEAVSVPSSRWSLSPSVRRLGLEAGLVLFRTVVLFMLTDALYTRTAAASSARKQQCWYASLTRTQSCADFFDFSDHIVLFYVQYMLPAIIEFSYALMSMTQGVVPNAVSSSASASSSSAATQNFRFWRLLVSAVVSGAVILLCLRSIMFTAMFFHTPLESIVGAVIALASAGLGVYTLAPTPLWTKVFTHVNEGSSSLSADAVAAVHGPDSADFK